MQPLYFDTSIPSFYHLLENVNKFEKIITYNGKEYRCLGEVEDNSSIIQKVVTIYVSTFLYTKTLADKQEDALSQYEVAVMYLTGKGCEKNLQEAFNYLKKAADQSHIDAQVYLAGLYFNGKGCDKSLQQAFNYLKKAVDQGYLKAQSMIGRMYFKGEGCERNLQEAFKYYKKAADQGDSLAQYEVATMYFNGLGCERNLQEAFKYYKKAADQEYALAQSMIGRMYFKGEGCEQNLQEAFTYYKKAADQGDFLAQYEVASMYYSSQGCEQHLQAAFNYYKKAADQEYALAQSMIGGMYFNGEGCEQNLQESFNYLKKAADQGDSLAQYQVGTMYLKGNGCEEDSKQAFYYFKKAAEQGDIIAQYNIGAMLFKGRGCEKNLEQALQYLQSSEKSNYTYSQYLLGRIFHQKNDFKDAINYYNLAANENFPKAQYRLGMMCEKGQGFEKSVKDAIYCYEFASNNYVKATYRLDYLNLVGQSSFAELIDKWVDFANAEQNLYDKMQTIQQLTSLNAEEQGHLHLWLTRLEKTAEFNKNQLQFTSYICELLQGLFKNDDFKKLFFSIVEFNNTCCEDRPAMGVNEINLAHSLLVKAENASFDEKIDLMIKGALTAAAINSISSIISQQEQNGTVKESAEVYMKMLNAVGASLPLSLGVHHMYYETVGMPSWIDPQIIISEVHDNWLSHFISTDIFKNLIEQNKDFQEAKKKLNQKSHRALKKLKNDPENFIKIQDLQLTFKRKEEKLFINWAHKLISEHEMSEEVKKIINFLLPSIK